MSKLLENKVRTTRPVLGSFENDQLLIINGAARSPVSLAKASGKHFEPYSSNTSGLGYSSIIGMNGANYDASYSYQKQQSKNDMLTKPTWDSPFPSRDLMLPSGELLVGNDPAYSDGVTGAPTQGSSSDFNHYSYRANDLSIISETARSGNYFIGETATHYYTMRSDQNGYLALFYKYDKTTGVQVHGSKHNASPAGCSWKLLHSDATSIILAYSYQAGQLVFCKYDIATETYSSISGIVSMDSNGSYGGCGMSNLIMTAPNVYRMFTASCYYGRVWTHDIDTVAGTVTSTNTGQSTAHSRTSSQATACWLMEKNDGEFQLFYCQINGTTSTYDSVGAMTFDSALTTYVSRNNNMFDMNTTGIAGIVFFGDGARTPEKIAMMGRHASGLIHVYQYNPTNGTYTQIDEIIDVVSGVRSIMGDSKGRLWCTAGTDYDVYIANHELSTTYSIHVQLPSDSNNLFYDAEDLARNIRVRVFDNLGTNVATDVTLEIYGHGTKFDDASTKRTVMTTVSGDGYVDVPVVISAPGAVQFSAYLTL